MPLHVVALTDLEVRDLRTFRHVPLVQQLHDRLVADGYRFAVAAEPGGAEDWSRVLFLNLTYWRGTDGFDILAEHAIDADVVAHVGWHHVVHQHLAQPGVAPSAENLLFGEAVASAFDLYLLGQVLGRTRSSTFLDSAVPAMTEAALNAGCSEAEAEALLSGVADDPIAAFEQLRTLLFEVTTALVHCADAAAAMQVLDGVRDRRFAPLLHHYELSNWVLYAQAHAGSRAPDERVRALDAALRAAPDSLAELAARCLG